MLITTHNTAKALNSYAKKTGRTHAYTLTFIRDIAAEINKGHRSPFINAIRRLAGIPDNAKPQSKKEDARELYHAKQQQQRIKLQQQQFNIIAQHLKDHPMQNRHCIIETFRGVIPQSTVLECIVQLKRQNIVSITHINRIEHYSIKTAVTA